MRNGAIYDVVIVGGGMVGTALACALGDQGIKTALVEAGDPPQRGDIKEDTPFDPRVSALTIASAQFLNNLGAWPGIAAQRISPFEAMHVWDAEGTGAVNFSAEKLGQPALGYIVENQITVSALFDSLSAKQGVDLLSPVRLESMSAEGDGAYRHLALSDGSHIAGRLVIGADGAQSKVREFAQIRLKQMSYQQKAIVATVETNDSNQATAWQRFLTTGPLAFLPLRTINGNDRLSSIVWSVDSDQAQGLMDLDDEQFLHTLTRAFEGRLGDVVSSSQRFCFPLQERHAEHYVQPRLALVGDAAHTIHPLAGQGVNLGLMDAAVLAEELIRAHERGIDPGDWQTLRRYQRRRRADNLAMMTLVGGFKNLFGQKNLPLRWLRSTGMRWMDKASPIKNHVAAQAMGLAGNLPKLARRVR